MNFLARLWGRVFPPQTLGRRGERLAAKHLRRSGYRLLESNRAVGDDEADLIMLDPDGRTVVIVEVKTRRSDDVSPELAVNRTKRFRMVRLAANLMKSRAYRDRPVRFDAVAIVWPQRGEPTLRHYAGAFESPI